MKSRPRTSPKRDLPAKPLEGSRLACRFVLLCCLVWALSSLGMLFILHARFIPIYAHFPLFGASSTPGFFMKLMSYAMAGVCIWGLVVWRSMRLKVTSLAGIVLLFATSILSSGFDFELFGSFGFPPDVSMRYELSRSYIFMLLEVSGIGLFILPTNASDGLKVLFSLFPLTRFLDGIEPSTGEGGIIDLERHIAIFTAALAAKVAYSVIVAVVAFRWGRRAGSE